MDITAEDIVEQLAGIDIGMGFIQSSDMGNLMAIIKDAKQWQSESDIEADAEDALTREYEEPSTEDSDDRAEEEGDESEEDSPFRRHPSHSGYPNRWGH